MRDFLLYRKVRYLLDSGMKKARIKASMVKRWRWLKDIKTVYTSLIGK